MILGSFLFKQKAREALKGNWQTALVVTFFAGIFLTVAQVLQSVALGDVQQVMYSISAAVNAMPSGVTTENAQFHEVVDLYNRLFAAVNAIPMTAWIGLLGANLIALILSPVLTVSCNRYFIARVDGEELGTKEGLLGRMGCWHKALWLYVVMYVRIFLWSLLFFIPGLIAALRYSMAPFYMAEDPSLSAKEALNKSKAVMKGMKMSLFLLQISFVFWTLLANMAQMLLTDISPVIALVAAQFLSLAISTYMNASFAAFYCTISRPQGVETLVMGMRRHFRDMGMEEDMLDELDEGDDGDNGDPEE